MFMVNDQNILCSISLLVVMFVSSSNVCSCLLITVSQVSQYSALARSDNCACFRTLPGACGLDKVAKKLKSYSVHGLLVIGGFEVNTFFIIDFF